MGAGSVDAFGGAEEGFDFSQNMGAAFALIVILHHFEAGFEGGDQALAFGEEGSDVGVGYMGDGFDPAAGGGGGGVHGVPFSVG